MLRKLSIVGAGTLLPTLIGADDPTMRVFLVLLAAQIWLIVQVRVQPYRLGEVRRGLRTLPAFSSRSSCVASLACSLAPPLRQDNVLKTVCDLATIVVCACELGYGWALPDGKGKYEAVFGMAMVGVLVSCVLAVGVKVCRLMVHMGIAHSAPRAVLALVDDTPSRARPEGTGTVPAHLQKEHRAMHKYRAMGVVSADEEELLRKYFERTDKEEQSREKRRVTRNLEFDGNCVYEQEFFVSSFPGIFEGIWKRMTEGVHQGLLSCACVFFQNKAGRIYGKHAEPCMCEFLAQAADEGAERTGNKKQVRLPQKGDEIKDEDGKVVLFNHCDEECQEAESGTSRVYGDAVYNKERKPIHDTFWNGNKPGWGCLWFGMWKHNVLALHECGQQAVVIGQCDKDAKPTVGEWEENDHPEWGTHMGLGNAQQGEVAWMRQEGIPVYNYTVDEYRQLVELAEQNAKLPSDRLAPEPELRENVRLASGSRGPSPGRDHTAVPAQVDT